MGAFWGITIGIIVGIVVFYVKEIIILQGRRYNALVFFEMKLHILLSTLDDNQFLIKKGVNTKGILVILPHELTIDENRIHKIGRITVKNKLMSLSLNLEKYNNSLRTAITGFKGNMENLKLDPLGLDSKEKQTLLDRAKDEFRRNLGEIGTFGAKLIDDIENLLVEGRFFLRKDKSRIPSTIWQRRYDKKELEKWKTEDKKQLTKEIELVQKKDQERRSKFGVRLDSIGGKSGFTILIYSPFISRKTAISWKAAGMTKERHKAWLQALEKSLEKNKECSGWLKQALEADRKLKLKASVFGIPQKIKQLDIHDALSQITDEITNYLFPRQKGKATPQTEDRHFWRVEGEKFLSDEEKVQVEIEELGNE